MYASYLFRSFSFFSVLYLFISYHLGDTSLKHKFSGTNQKTERRRPFGTGLVRHCPQGLFSPFFSFLRALFFRPFRLSLAPTICPWVSEDGDPRDLSDKSNHLLMILKCHTRRQQAGLEITTPRQTRTRKRAGRTERDFRCLISRSDIGKARSPSN